MTDLPLDLDARPRARDLKPGDVLVWTGQPRPMDLAKVIDRRKDDDTGWWMTDSSGLADFVWDDGAAWTTVRALCDAADEVERLRAQYEALKGRTVGPYPEDACWETHAYFTPCAACERDASRTAHAALAAELRALHTGPNPHVPNGVDRGAFLLGWEDAMESAVAALDRHAPTTGATP